MRLSKFISISLILLSLFGCKKKEVEKVDKFQFEKDVINNIFVEIVDSIYMDRRIIIPPPPPPIFDSKTNKVDSLEYYKELKEYWHERDSIKKDTAKILIGVNDFIENISEFDTLQLNKSCKNLQIVYDKSKEVENFKFDLTPFKNNKKFDFQYLLKYPKVNLWNYNDYSVPVGAITISRIQFNKTKTRGIMPASASCGGGKCGRGFEITIENKSGKWHITNINQTWVS